MSSPRKSLQNANSTKSAAAPSGSRLTAWKKPHPLDAYYGPSHETYKAPDSKAGLDGKAETTPQENDNSVKPVQHGYSVPDYRPPPSLPQSEINGPTCGSALEEGQRSHPGPPLSAVQNEAAPTVLDPHLQILCGPMLRYDTVRDGMWYGAVMIVTNDTESIYNPFPTLTFEWEAENESPFTLNTTPEESEEKAPYSDGQTTMSPESELLPTSPSKSPQQLDSDEYSDSSPSEPEPEETATSPSSQSPTKSRFGTWASSITKKLKDVKLRSPGDDFSGRPPERIAKTERAVKEKQRWATKRVVEGEAIYKYAGIATTATFWRFMLEVPVNPDPTKGMKVHYAINKPVKPGSESKGFEYSTGPTDITFHIAPTGSDMRFAAFSCNGFSEGVDQDTFKGEGFSSGFDPVWADLLQRHEERPFHALVGGGDQIYCDSLMKEPELQEYVKLQKPQDKATYPLTESIAFAMDRYYFNHYCLIFRSGCFGRAISQIPMVNMLDDHDLIDGFGSYPEELQRSPFFKHVGTRGYFWFLLFQLFTVDGVDGTLVEAGQHTFKSMIIGSDGAWIPFPSHSSLHWFGAHTWLLMLDCRAERRQDMILSPETYQQIFAILGELPDQVEHLIVQVGIPIAYPRMNLTERLMHPDGVLAKVSRTGIIPGLTNKYNKDIELLDDLSDHWTAKQHKRERNWFISQLQYIAKAQRVRVTFISGDVHLASLGLFKTHSGKVKKGVEPSLDHRWMLNIVTSAIVNTPPPPAIQAMVNSLASHKHRTMHKEHTDEVMIPLFQEGLRTDKRRLNYIAGARNYAIGERDPSTGEFIYSYRVERNKGQGETKGYVVRAPAPAWTAEN